MLYAEEWIEFLRSKQGTVLVEFLMSVELKLWRTDLEAEEIDDYLIKGA